MATYNTGNSVPSTDPRDLNDNMQNLDSAMNGQDDTWTNRLGQSRSSIPKLFNDFESFIEGKESDADVSLSAFEANLDARLPDAISQYSALTSRGAWATGTAYVVNDLWSYDGNWYFVPADYTSGATAQADIDNGNAVAYQSTGPYRVVFNSLSEAIVAVTTSPSLFDFVETESYYSEAECSSYGIDYPNGGGAKYRVVPSGTGTDDGGSYIDAGTVQLQLIIPENGLVPVTCFGAKVGEHGIVGLSGIPDSTTEIDNALAWVDNTYTSQFNQGVPDVTTGIRDQFGMNGQVGLFFPRGVVVYSGSGRTPTDPPHNSGMYIVGEDPNLSTLWIKSDTHLLRNVDDDGPVWTYVVVKNLKVVGGRGFWFSTKENNKVTRVGYVAENCHFMGYTSVAFGSKRKNAARWWVQGCQFVGGNTGTPVGVFLPPEAGMVEVVGNVFHSNKYHIVCGSTIEDGMTQSNIGPNNSFFDIVSNSSDVFPETGGTRGGTDKVADVLFIPSYKTVVGRRVDGWGISIFGNRHSNENSRYSQVVMIADLDGAYQDHEIYHSTSISTGWFKGWRIYGNILHRVNSPLTDFTTPSGGWTEDRGGRTGSIVYSYASEIGGHSIFDNECRELAYFVRYDDAISPSDIDAGGACLNRYSRLRISQEIASRQAPETISNIAGAGLSQAKDDTFLGVLTGGLDSGYAADCGVTQLLPDNRIAPATVTYGDGYTVTVTTDVDGNNDAATVTPDSGFGQYMNLHNNIGTIEAGRPFFIEFDLKKAPTLPMDRVMVDVTINGYLFSQTIKLTDYWQRIKIPMITAASYSTGGDLTVRITAGDETYGGGSEFFVPGVKENFMIGRRSIYHATGPVPYSAQ